MDSPDPGPTFIQIFTQGFYKSNKSSKVNDSLTHLALALGGELALRNSSPVCGGRYNNSVAQEVGGFSVNFTSNL